MAKTYKLTITKSDNTTEEITFTVPQGEKGDTGATGAKGAKGATGDKGVGGLTIFRNTNSGWNQTDGCNRSDIDLSVGRYPRVGDLIFGVDYNGVGVRIAIITAVGETTYTTTDVFSSVIRSPLLGEYGAKGATGDKGETGDKGATGDKGETGDKGATGDTGVVITGGTFNLVS